MVDRFIPSRYTDISGGVVLLKAIFLGIVASVFFASAFIFNRQMNLTGGHWVWSAALRYFIMLPLLVLLVLRNRRLGVVIDEIKRKPWSWLLWSTVGFGVFYTPLCFASAYGPAWLVAATWQITIVAGALLSPLFHVEVPTASGVDRVRGQVPLATLYLSLIILLGIGLMQVDHARGLAVSDIWLGVFPVIVAAVAYPLGNRKMMELCQGRLSTEERVLGMTLASMPFWLVLAVYGLRITTPPTGNQVVQATVVAVCSGVIATILFFRATDLVRGDMARLAAVEATQAGEVLFSLLGEILLIGGAYPGPLSIAGMLVVMAGMLLHAQESAQPIR